MLRILAIAAMFALAVPSLAVAQAQPGHPAGKPAPRAGPAPRPGPAPGARPGLARPAVVPHGPVGPGPRAAVVPRPLGPGARQFVYGGHPINRVHIAPFAYPNGWAYRRWAAGAILPPLFLVPAYYYGEWAALGLPPPQPGFQWVRYGPDLLLVDTTTGQVADVAYGVFY